MMLVDHPDGVEYALSNALLLPDCITSLRRFGGSALDETACLQIMGHPCSRSSCSSRWWCGSLSRNGPDAVGGGIFVADVAARPEERRRLESAYSTWCVFNETGQYDKVYAGRQAAFKSRSPSAATFRNHDCPSIGKINTEVVFTRYMNGHVPCSATCLGPLNEYPIFMEAMGLGLPGFGQMMIQGGHASQFHRTPELGLEHSAIETFAGHIGEGVLEAQQSASEISHLESRFCSRAQAFFPLPSERGSSFIFGVCSEGTNERHLQSGCSSYGSHRNPISSEEEKGALPACGCNWPSGAATTGRGLQVVSVPPTKSRTSGRGLAAGRVSFRSSVIKSNQTGTAIDLRRGGWRLFLWEEPDDGLLFARVMFTTWQALVDRGNMMQNSNMEDQGLRSERQTTGLGFVWKAAFCICSSYKRVITRIESPSACRDEASKGGRPPGGSLQVFRGIVSQAA
ncbi:hypothetical protein QBC36DRAFT_309440 [Triangularia setosa]|uniref:Uncharacterized protein n=1 Tax=Triangularia setosa TaxID=2587417 RepID=A0AAN6WCS7_9PEZI|nr:hypothetical protein QBC36DRAFT_309440 [Podospora setosa]